MQQLRQQQRLEMERMLQQQQQQPAAVWPAQDEGEAMPWSNDDTPMYILATVDDDTCAPFSRFFSVSTP